MRMNRLQVNFDSFQLSIRSMIGPKRLFYGDAETDSISKPILISEPISIPDPISIPEPTPNPEPIPEPISEPISESIPETDSGPTVWNRFQKTSELAKVSFFPSILHLS